MAPSKEAAQSGYVIEKVAEDKPAAQAGVEPGWTVKRVASTDCQGLASAAVQALLKDAALPVEVQFEKPEEEPWIAEGITCVSELNTVYAEC
ncbi:DED1 [Symbiodinium natans]|uniref:DED1 protein n=1 Tax=Symbiodinium natans TaxID=878477 RepID=A0A812KMT4_9DINO|nr:DED1 [Symbiodinium natans]